MEELNIIIEPELEFTLKKCGDVVPYGITPEERAKLAGIEENANNYTHPVKHPSSILDVVDVVDGAANKFLNERGEMVAVAHANLTEKNSETAFRHVDTTVIKQTLVPADMVAIKDSVTGNMVLTPKSNFIDSIQLASYTYNGNLEVHLTSIDVTTSTFVKNSHGFLNNDNIFPVINIGNIELFLKDVCFGGLELVNYYVVNSTQNTFQISKTLGGLPITLVSNPTLDLSKWHFEKGTTSAITISGLSNEKKIYADFEGRSLGIYKSIYIYPNGVTPIALEWLFANNTAGATVALTYGRIILGTMGDVFSKFRCLIDYSSFLTESVNGYVIQSSLTNQRFTSTFLDLEIMSPKYKNGEITTLTFNFTAGSYIANGSTIKLYRA